MPKHKQIDDLIINPKHPAKCSVIWLHGLGADGYDFVDIVPQLKLPEELAVRFVFPHAPIRSVSYAQGVQMRAWFDLGIDLSNIFIDQFKQDELGIRASQRVVEQLVAQELAAGIASRRIVLAGFSQGAAMALQCGLRYPEPLGGILSLSGFLPLAGSLAREKSVANQNVPIFLAHGAQDELVPLAVAQNNLQSLVDLGFNAKLVAYNTGHSVCAEEIQDITAWMKEVLERAYQE